MREHRSKALMGAVLVVSTMGYMFWPVTSADAQQQVVAGGRYVMLNAQYIVTSDSNSPKEVVGLFKLDTQTGESWRYTEHVRRDGEVRPRWISTRERPE